MTAPETQCESYRAWTREVARFGDTDRFGHINNAAFATYLESARVDLLLDPAAPLGGMFVIARLVLDFRAEMQWRGTVEIGTVVRRIGRSSVTFGHGIFKDGVCCATAECVVVLIDEATRRSTPLSEAVRARLGALSE
jgi:acyl-CoA thioester hydrolase